MVEKQATMYNDLCLVTYVPHVTALLPVTLSNAQNTITANRFGSIHLTPCSPAATSGDSNYE
jgi:hypothetical protein